MSQNISDWISGPINGRGNLFSVLGPPGAGKTTLALELSRAFGADLMVMSQFLSEFRTSEGNSTLSRTVRRHMELGTQIDDPSINEKVLARVSASSAELFILDGFPRTHGTAHDLEVWSRTARRNIIVLHVYTSLQTCKTRFLSKTNNKNAAEIFKQRMDHYSTVERHVISAYMQFPIINVET